MFARRNQSTTSGSKVSEELTMKSTADSDDYGDISQAEENKELKIKVANLEADLKARDNTIASLKQQLALQKGSTDGQLDSSDIIADVEEQMKELQKLREAREASIKAKEQSWSELQTLMEELAVITKETNATAQDAANGNVSVKAAAGKT